jgi:hypothetical protein
MSFNRYSDDCEAPHGILRRLKQKLPTRYVTTYRFAWLIMPFPPNTGMIDVEAVLNDTTRPSDTKGDFCDGRLL